MFHREQFIGTGIQPICLPCSRDLAEKLHPEDKEEKNFHSHAQERRFELFPNGSKFGSKATAIFYVLGIQNPIFPVFSTITYGEKNPLAQCLK